MRVGSIGFIQHNIGLKTGTAENIKTDAKS